MHDLVPMALGPIDLLRTAATDVAIRLAGGDGQKRARGRAALQRLLLGSVATRVLWEAPCNAMAVPPGRTARDATKVRSSS